MSEKHFGRFNIKHFLGQGNLTRSFLVYDPYRDSNVVLKVLLPPYQQLLQHPRPLRQFRQELYNLTQFQHPAVVPLYETVQVQGYHALVQPFMQGRSLAQHLKPGSIPTDKISGIVSRIAQALDAACQLNIIHLHLTPQNILFDRAGNVYVNDFGLVSLASFHPQLSKQVGVPAYMSPEQFMSDHELDCRADIYALGCIIFEMLTGHLPYQASTKTQFGVSHFTEPIPSVRQVKPDLSREWQHVFDRALAKKPAARFQEGASLAVAVEHANKAAFRRGAMDRLGDAWSHAREAVITRLPTRPQFRWPKFAARPLTPKAITRKIIMPILLVFILGMTLFGQWPRLGAYVADPLRAVVGNQAVAQLEAVYFRVQDFKRQIQLRMGLAEPEAPWEVTPELLETPTPLATSTPVPVPATIALMQPAPTATPHPTPLPTATLSPWQQLTAILPFGSLVGEGVWSPYVVDTNGNVVVKRTFLQPDLERPLTTVAIVAFDLYHTRLDLVLGTEDPTLPDGPHGDGFLPLIAQRPGYLLATFNGGFKATHGEFGAMANGLVAVPAKNGLATIAIDGEGNVAIGEWGTDISPDKNWVAWRQNAKMVIHDGEINPEVYSDSVEDWGGTFTYDIVTWRSGLGINQQGNILYYFAGPGLSMPALAAAMIAANIENAMLLDINEYWVHFAAIRDVEGTLQAEPLFADGMDLHASRYLHQSTRDFFYVTLRP